MEESASMYWAREVRGMASMLNEVTPLVAQGLDQIGVDHRLQECDQALPAAHHGDFLGCRFLNLGDQVGLFEESAVPLHDVSAGRGKGIVEEVCFGACACFYQNRVTLGNQLLDDVWHEGDATLVGIGLPGYPNRDRRTCDRWGGCHWRFDDLLVNVEHFIGRIRRLLRRISGRRRALHFAPLSTGVFVGARARPICPDRTPSQRPAGKTRGLRKCGDCAGSCFKRKW